MKTKLDMTIHEIECALKSEAHRLKIVLAVNSHQELLSIVKRELEMEGSVSESEMRQAIAKAEGK